MWECSHGDSSRIKGQSALKRSQAVNIAKSKCGGSNGVILGLFLMAARQQLATIARRIPASKGRRPFIGATRCELRWTLHADAPTEFEFRWRRFLDRLHGDAAFRESIASVWVEALRSTGVGVPEERSVVSRGGRTGVGGSERFVLFRDTRGERRRCTWTLVGDIFAPPWSAWKVDEAVLVAKVLEDVLSLQVECGGNCVDSCVASFAV